MMKARNALILLALLSAPVMADPPFIVNPQTGEYLGNLSTNRFDPNSVNNPYGQYGNRYSPQSIKNPYGQYGNRYSNDSPSNPWATNAPALIHRGR